MAQKFLLLTQAFAMIILLGGVSYLFQAQQFDRLTPHVEDFFPHTSKPEVHHQQQVKDSIISEEIKTTQQQIINSIKSQPYKAIAYVNQLSGYSPSTILASLGIGSPCYNIFILTYWKYQSESHGDPVSIFANPKQHIGSEIIGETIAELQEELQKLYHNQGSLLFISAFGNAQNPTDYDPVLVAKSLAKWANENPYFDGLDIDYQDTDALKNGKAISWLTTFQKTLKENLDNQDLLITHAPEAGYFSNYYGNFGYYVVDEQVGNLIDWYNMKYYINGENMYNTYQSLFIVSKNPFINSAVQQVLNDYQIRMDKIILGRPANEQSSGYMTPSSFADGCNKFHYDRNPQVPGFFIWEFSQDRDCSFYNSFTSIFWYKA